jgi:peptide/nickel transport system substrate-binding protein
MTDLTRRRFLEGVSAGALGLVSPGFLVSGSASAQPKPGERVPALQMWVPNWPDLMEIGRLMARSYEQIGLTLEVQSGSMQAGLAAIVGEQKVPHIVGMSWGGSPERLDPDFWVTEFLHSRRTAKGGLNYGGYRSSEYDALADAQRAEMDPTKRIELVRKAAATAANDNPTLVLLHRTTVQAYNKARFEGVVSTIGAGIALPYVPWTYVGLKPKTGRRVPRVVIANDIITTNPFATPEVFNAALLRLIYAPLVVRDKDAKVVPWAAEAVAVIDPTTVDVTIRTGLSFTDGKPVTAEDLKFTLDFIAEKRFPALARVSDAVASAQVTGPMTVRIKLKQPSASFVPNALGYLFIAPKHVWSQVAGNPIEFPNDAPVGYGPFKFKEWRKGEFVTFEANKSFFTPPQIDAAIWLVVPNLENQLAMMERGDADLVGSNLDSEQGKRLAAHRDLAVVNVPNHGLHEARLNLALAPLDNPAIRLALQHATDRKQMIDVVFAGQATPATNSLISPELADWKSQDLPNPEFSIEKARAVLKAAGFTWDANGKLLYPGT